MNTIGMILIALGALLIIGFVLYTHSVTLTEHSIVFEETTLYKGTAVPVYSSDGVDRILFNRSDGMYEYNTSTEESNRLTTQLAKGIAYDGTQFMYLSGEGMLYRVSQTGVITNIGNGYAKLYDTIDGYYIDDGVSGSVTGETGSLVKNKGNYGLITLVVS